MNYSFSDLVDLDELQSLCEQFTQLTGFATAILDMDGTVLVATGWQEACSGFHRVHPATAARCRESDTILANRLLQGEEYTLYRCGNGLIDVAVPIIVDEAQVGNLFSGQFLLEPPDMELFRRQAEESGFDEKPYLDAVSRVPVVTEERVRLVMGFLCRLAQMIGRMGLANKRIDDANLIINDSPAVLFRWRTSEGWPIEFVSESVTQFGYTPEELMTGEFPYSSVVHPDDLERLVSEVDDYTSRGEDRLQREYRIVTKGGDVRWVEERTVTERDAEGRLILFRGIVLDITERRRTEDALRFTQFAVDNTFAQAFWTTPSGDIFYVNDAACRTLGYTREELVEMTISDIGPTFPPEVFADHWRELQKKGAVTLETWHRAKDGRVYPVEVNANHVVFDGKEYNCAFASDISERKRAEEALKKSEERMRLFFERQLVGMAITSPEKRWVQVNDKLCEMLGYSRDELSSLTWAELTHPDDLAAEVEHFERLLAGENDGYSLEKRFIRKDGMIVFTDLSVGCVRTAEGFVDYALALLEDITERRKAQEALQMSQFIVDKASIGICRGHEDGRILYANEHFARMLGYTREELCSMTYFDIVPDMGEKRWRDHRRLLRAAGSRKFEAVHRRKDSTIFPVEVTVNYLEFGEEPFSCSFTQDITERKKVEEALRESERKFRLLTEASPNAIIVIRGERIVYANHAATRVLGFTAEQLTDMEFWNVVHDDFRDAARKRILARLRGEPVSTSFEYRLVGGRGEDKWVVAASVSMDYGGTPAILVTFADITEAKQAEAALRESEANLRLAMHMAKLVQWEYDVATGMFRCDDQLYTQYGTSKDREGGYQVPADSFMRKFVHPDDIPMVMEVTARSLSDSDGTDIIRMDHRIVRADGEERYISSFWENIRDGNGRAVRARGVNQDVTERMRAEEERKNLEAQLHQAQKIEAVGQLAGGIAHDFNNILTAIMGFAEVMSLQMEQGNPLHRHVRQILAAAERAADLTSGLLAFSRKQVLHVRPIDVSEVVNGFKKMLRRLIPEDIHFRVKTAPTGMTVMADRGQMEQVLMNLVTNARDAMPRGGELTIETDSFIIDEASVKSHGFGKPGRYARIVVEDIGCGMDEETREKIFEPFFTTKQVGKGTGLGLSIIYGIVKQHNGFITVDSLPERGTTFCVYLPLVDQEKQELSALGRPEPAPGGTETILLAEDDDVVRELNRSILEDAGYTVIEATDGREALEMFKERGACVDMLVTDVIMPTMDGKRLCEEIMGIRPAMKVLFMSGYSADILDDRGVADDGINFLPKPVMPSELLKRIREILDHS
jgi:PAS domain S-box-containing protein